VHVGIYGSPSDIQVETVTRALKARGCDVLVVDAQALNDGMPHTFDGSRFVVGGVDISACRAWYLRHVMTPIPPAFEKAGEWHLYRDWFIEYMRRRERFAWQLSFLLAQGFAKVPVVNPPEHGGVVQMKLFQLFVARRIGLRIPETCVTNDPETVRAFAKTVGEVVYKPSLGGGPCVALDDEARARLSQLVASPVIFQERARGKDVRVTLVGDDVVSAVVIPSTVLDFRFDPTYRDGRAVYEAITIPDDVIARVKELMRACGLVFSGVDLKLGDDGSWTFLEANSSPIYLDVERKTGAPITERLVDLLLKSAESPRAFVDRVDEARRTSESFVKYALPFAPQTLVS